MPHESTMCARAVAVVAIALLLGAAPPEVVELAPEPAGAGEPAGAAEAASGLSIDDALRIAVRESEIVRASEPGIGRARGESLRASSDWYPQVGATGSYQHTFLSEYDGIFAAPEPGEEAPGTPIGAAFEDLPFGADDTWRIDVALRQTVYAGGRRTAAVRIADAGEALAALDVATTRAQVALDAARAYYDVLLAERLLEIARGTLASGETTLEHTTLGVEVGAQPAFDALRARVEVENQRVTVLEQERARDAAALRLRQLLELDEDVPLVLTTSLLDDLDEGIGATAAGISGAEAAAGGAEVAADDAAAGTPGATGPDRLVVRQASEAVRIAEAARDLARSQRLPQIGATGGLGFVSYPDTPVPPVDPDEWRTNLFAGAQVDVPIFTGFRLRGDALVAEADLYEARADLDQAREIAALDTADALDELDAAQARWEATVGTVRQAQEAYAIAEVRFQEDIAPQIELSDARLLLQQALANRARAARDLQLARIRVALLPWLPPGVTTTAAP